jgi:ABC-type transporter Mla MlaB component
MPEPMPDAAFPSDVTLGNALQALESARAGCRAGALDLAPLEHFDSGAVAVLIALRREFGPTLELRNPPSNLRKLASLYGVESILFDR